MNKNATWFDAHASLTVPSSSQRLFWPAGRFARVMFVLVGILTAVSPAWGAPAPYRSQGTGNWNAAATWQTNNGSAWVAANAAPTSANATTIEIISPNVVTVNATSNPGNGGLTVDQGATLTVSSTLNVTNLTVNGTMSTGAACALGNVTVGSTGIFNHNASSTLTFNHNRGGTTAGNGDLDIQGTYNCNAGGNGNFVLAASTTLVVENGAVFNQYCTHSTVFTANTGSSFTFLSGGSYVLSTGTSQGELPVAANTTWQDGSLCNLSAGITPGQMASQSFSSLTVGFACSAGATTTVRGTLTLAAGAFGSGGNVTMASGSSIVRTAGSISAAPVFSGTVNVTYNNTASTTTGPELPTGSSVLQNLTITDTAGVVLNANATVNGTFAATYVSGTPALAAGSHTLAFSGSPAVNITVSGGALSYGSSYTIISSGGTTVSGALGALTVAGSGAPYSSTPTVSDSTGALVLTIPPSGVTPTFSNLTSPSISYGTASLTLTGTCNNGTTYPVNGDTITATINGHASASGTFTDGVGDFSITYNDATLATDGVGGSPYTITYNYGGHSGTLLTASDATTSLTVTKASQTITFGSGSSITQAADSTSPFADAATATSGLTVTYSSDNSVVATVNSSGNVSIVGLAGTAHILADQSGNGNYNAATEASQTLTVGPGAVSASHSVISASPTSITANGTATSIITVTERDAKNNQENGAGEVTPSLGASAGSMGSLTDNGNGTFTATLTSPTTTGTASITGTISSVAIGTPASVTLTPGAIDHYLVTAPAGGSKGVAFTVTVTAQDLHNNTVTTDNAASVSLTGLGSATPAVTPKTLASGVATFSVTDNSAETITIGATDGAKTGTAGNPTVIKSQKYYITLPGETFSDNTGNSGTVTPQTAGTPFVIGLRVVDDSTNTVTGVNNTGVTISFSGPNNAPNGTLPAYTTTVDFSAGVATTTLNTTLTKAETTAISATDGTIGGYASSSLTVNPSNTVSYVVSAASPQTAGLPFPVSVTAKDAYGNPVTTDNSTSVTMTSNTGNVKFDGDGDSTYGDAGDNAKTLTAGTFIVSAEDMVKESATITATDGNSISGNTGPLQVNPAAVSAAQSVISASPASITANGSSTSAITVTEKDAYGNQENSAGEVTPDAMLASAGALGSLTDNHNGTFSATLTSSTVAGTANVTGNIGGMPIGTSASVTFAPGALDHFVISAISSPQTAGTAITGITLTAQDVNNNTVTGFAGPVTFSGTAGVTGTSGSFAAGQLTGVSVTPTVAGSSKTFIVTDSVSGKTGTATITTINPGALDHFAIAAISSPQAVTVPFNITVTAQDVDNNTVPGFTGTVTYGGTAGVTGTSAAFVAGVLTNASVTAANTGSSLTVTVDDLAGHTGSATIATINFLVNYRTLAGFTSGNWTGASTWEADDGLGGAFNATATPPTSANALSVEIRSGNVTLDTSETVFGTLVDSGATLTVAASQTLTVADGVNVGAGAGADLDVLGTVANAGTISLAGTGTPTITFESTGVYDHQATGAVANKIPAATWKDGSLCKVTGLTSATAAPSVSASQDGNGFYDFTYNCTGQGTATTFFDAPLVRHIVSVLSTGSTGVWRCYNTAATARSWGALQVSAGTLNLWASGSSTAPQSLAVGNVTVSSGATLQWTGSSAVAYTVNVSGNWSNSGTVTFTTAGVAVNFSGTTQSIGGSGATTFRNATVNSGATVTLGVNTATASATTFTVNGTLNCGTYAVTGGSFTTTAGSTLGIGSPAGITTSGATGNIQTTTRTYSAAATYDYNGAAAQVTGNALAATVNGLTVNNSAGVSLAAAETVTNLTLTGGVVAGNVTVAGGGTLTGGGSGSYVNGTLQLPLTTASTTASFPVGDATAYAGATLANLTVTGNGTLKLANTAAQHPNISTSGINPAKDVKRYWSFTPGGGLAVSGYDLTLNFAAGDVIGGADPAQFVVRHYSSPNWAGTAGGTLTGTSAQATGLVSFSDFAVGQSGLVAAPTGYTRAPGVMLKIKIADLLTNASDTDGQTPVLTAVATSTNGMTVTTNSTYVLYQNPNNVPDSFTYTISDSLGSAQGTVSITVAGGQTGQAKSVSVSGGVATVNFAGIPGYPYEVQRADDVNFTVNVTVLLTTNAPGNGAFSWTDTTATGPTAFYRLVSP